MCFNYKGVIQTWCKENAVMNLHSLWPLDVVHVQSYWCSAFPSGVPRAAKALAMGLCFFSSSRQMCPLVIKLTCNEAICRCCFKCKGCCIPQWVRASLLEMVKGCLNSILEIHDNWGLNFLWNNFSHPYGCYSLRAPGSVLVFRFLSNLTSETFILIQSEVPLLYTHWSMQLTSNCCLGLLCVAGKCMLCWETTAR